MNKLISSLAVLLSGVLLFTGCDTSEDDVMPVDAGKIILTDDFFSTQINTAISLDILANDTITAEAELTIEQPKNGELIPDSVTGTYLYKPYSDTKTEEVINYKVCKTGDCQTATIRIKVMDMGACQVRALADAAETEYPKPVRLLKLLDNDNTCGRVALTVPMQYIQGGEAVVDPANDHAIIFTPTEPGPKIVKFYYQINGANGTDKAWVTVKVKSGITELTNIQTP